MRIFAVLFLLIASSLAAEERALCAVEPHDQFCPHYPADQTAFVRTHDYMLMSPTVQEPFDLFAWQAFLALNWPEGGAHPGDAPEAARAWDSFPRRAELFGADAARAACGAPEGRLLIDGTRQADGHQLIDREGNFVVYDTRVNWVVADYIRANALDTLAGQMAFAGDVSFPMGEVGGQHPSILLKLAWRIVAEPDASALMRDATVFVPARDTLNGEAMCLDVAVALSGFHIVTRTSSGNGDDWIWTTFEHVRNAPTAANARSPNSIYAPELFPGGCMAPEQAEGFAFFDPERSPEANEPARAALWAAAMPLARDQSGAPVTPPQVVRCWDRFAGTEAVNAHFQEALAGTIWANYMLINAQWRGTLPSPLAGQGEVPRYSSNITMETFFQDQLDASCLGCHSTALTADGRDANFTFILSEAR